MIGGTKAQNVAYMLLGLAAVSSPAANTVQLISTKTTENMMKFLICVFVFC